ncbi:MAG: choice-of-anchor L domain-containing protein [Cyanobacterium sp. T60_A2020_053]|nr:choice-of-anchor L domain-containing protein [Cyanobacterium sp. T60_A2020_053]
MNKKVNLLLTVISGLLFNHHTSALAQEIKIDGTTATIITREGQQITIDGTSLSRDGQNLFHSFQEFGLSQDQIATFLTNPNIQNILTRVTGGNVSQLNGLMEVMGGNSNLFFLNPAGIVFGDNFSLNVPADFTATTATGIGFGEETFSALHPNNYDNLLGNPSSFIFNQDNIGSIVNKGDLSLATGQNLTLIGGNVINTGKITTPSGNILIQAIEGTSRIKITPEGSLLSLELNIPQDEQGNLLGFTPQDLPTLLTGEKVTINNTEIPTGQGNAIVNNSLNADGVETGGSVTVLGKNVGLLGANLSAQGETGGSVKLGGDWQGKGNLPTSAVTVMDSDSTINVDGSQQGGTVVLWSKENTQFYGNISARNGGKVETSSALHLSALGSVLAGEWLLDPSNIVINRTEDGSIDGNFDGGNPNLFQPTADNSFVDATQIENSLNEGVSVTITTASEALAEGNITVETDINVTQEGEIVPTLSLIADNDIIFKNNFLGGGALNVALTAGGDIKGADLEISSNNGSINIISGGGINIDNLDSSSLLSGGNGGNINLETGGNILITSLTTSSDDPINSNGGNLSISSGGNVALGGIFTGGAISSGDITITGSNILLSGAVADLPSIPQDNSAPNPTEGAGDITITGGDTIVLSGLFGKSLTVSGNLALVTLKDNPQLAPFFPNGGLNAVAIIDGKIITSGNQTVSGNLFLGNDFAFQGNNLTFNQINSANINIPVNPEDSAETTISNAFGVLATLPIQTNANPRNLLLDSAGLINFNADVGRQNPLNTLTIADSQKVNLGNDLISVNDILINAPLALSGNILMDSQQGSITVTEDTTVEAGSNITLSATEDLTLNNVTVIPASEVDETRNDGANSNNNLTVTASNDAQQLADAIVGEGVDVTEAKFTGADTSAGSFSGGSGVGLGIDTGIILSTGNVNDAVGANTEGGKTTDNLTPGDVDLNGLITEGLTQDASVLEITFETEGGNLFVNYIFASEEYNEFVNSSFNDVFGFFLNGRNIAVVPNTNQPVTVNTINNGNPSGVDATNPQLFNDNTINPETGLSPFNLEFDGFTNTLTAQTGNLEPGSYTIKFAIADVSDTALDSAVFIQGSSFGDTRVLGGNTGGLANINLESRQGSVITNNLNLAGVRGADLNINAGNNVLVNTINARGSDGRGGIVDIRTGNLFQATGVLPESNVSISTVGTESGDLVKIQYGGLNDNNLPVPFQVTGEDIINGTKGNIETSRLNISDEVFPFTSIQENVSIISQSPSVEAPVETPIDPREELLTEGKIFPNPTNNESPSSTNLDPNANYTPNLAVTTIEGAQGILQDLATETGVKSSFIHVTFTPANYNPATADDDLARREALKTQEFEAVGVDTPDIATFLRPDSAPSDRLDILMITPDGKPLRVVVPVSREEVVQTATDLWANVSNAFDLNDDYLPDAQKLYSWLVEPLEELLTAQEIENLVYLLPGDIRFVPLAALHDAKSGQFLVEKYSSGLAPSINLNDNRYRSIKDRNLLAMGASEFANPEVVPLPAAGLELPTVQTVWQNNPNVSRLDSSNFTLDNVRASLNQSYGIVHFATHGEFNPDDLSQSYIQLYDSRLNINELRTLNLGNLDVDLLVLSACNTAFGNELAELGFAGLAVQAGVRSALGSVWQVSDTGTLALMTEFYQQLQNQTIKAEALRQAQLSMLTGDTAKSADGEIITTSNKEISLADLPPVSRQGEDFSHPFYWAPFTMIGNPW